MTEAFTSVAPNPETENAATKRHGQRTFPLRAVLTNLLVFGAILGGILARAIQLCGGHLGCPMDDTYIHMAMAKSFALHGTWGITQYGFTSSTSSPLFKLLVAACYRLSGVHENTPLLINVVLSVAVVAWCVWDLQNVRHGQSRVGWLTLLVVLAIPLPILALSGREHVLQILLVLIFLRVVSRGVRARVLRGGDIAWMAIISALLVVTRYVDAFLTLVAGTLFFARRRWPFFPTSLLLKANLPPGSSWGMVRAFLASAVFLMCFARVGWYFRYEA